MSKKIMLLALGAASVMMLALPAMASAQVPLHVVPQPIGEKTIDGTPGAILSKTGGTTVTCNGFSGKATFTSTTGGTMELTFGPHCTESVFNSTCTSHNPVAPSGTITTTTLNFDLVTVAPNKSPGVLVTPASGGSYAHFTCAGGLVNITVEAHIGVIGTITAPTCNGESTQATIKFEKSASHGIQKHQFLEGTPGVLHNLKSGGETAAQEATGTLTMGTKHLLQCT